MPDWNKEISFRKKKPAAASAEPSIWKREITLGRKKQRPVVSAAPSGDVPWWRKEIGGRKKATKPQRADVPFWKQDGPPARADEAPQPRVAEPEPVVAPAGAAPEPVPEPEADYAWLTAAMDAEPEAPAAAWPPRSDGPPVAAAWPPPSEAPAPPPVAVAVPVPVEPAPAPVPEAKVPFWKKELSLGGARKKTEKPQRAPKPEAAGKVPFWKRELGRPKVEKTPKPKSESVPFWKKELSLGGSRPKQPRAPKSKPVAAASQRQEKALIVGLKIGASQVAAARVQNNGHPHLLQVAREPLDDGVVVGGELRDVEALAEALKRFFAKHKLPRKGVRLGIANNRIGVRTFEISGIDEPRQLANAIRFRAQETLPIPLEEAVLDWQVLREETDGNGVTTRRVLLVVAYRELVDRYVAACRKAGIQLEGIDLEAFAMLRALIAPAAQGEQPPGAQVVVNVGHDRSTFAVSDGRICESTRVLAWGGQNLNVGIARALDLTPSEAAPLKHALSLVDDTVALETVTAEHAAAVCAAVRAELQAFARELVSSLRFYQNQPNSLGIAELLLTGGTAELPGLAEELQRLIGVTVRVGDPLARVKVGKRVDEDQSGSLAVAIGLGIED